MQNLTESKDEFEDKIDFDKVGRRIQYIRKLRKITQADLSATCGCTSNHLSAVENGTNKPSLEMLMKISIALDKSVDYFLMDSPHAYPKYLIETQISEKLNQCNTKMLQVVNNILESMLEYQEYVDKENKK